MAEVLVVIGVGGMGDAIARRIGTGRHLVVADFDETALDRAAAGLAADGYRVQAHRVDVSQRDSVAALAAAAAALGPVTAVAHTAGLSPTQAQSAAILSVDLAGVAFVLDEFQKIVAPGAAAVVIASMAAGLIAGYIPGDVEAALATTPADDLLALEFLNGPAVAEPGAAYAVAKRGNVLRVQVASRSWGTRGARVNSISPGVISTPMGRQELAGESGAVMRAMIDASGTARVGTPADIAAVAAFLLGPEASFITGTDVLVDGGVVAAARHGAL